MTHIILQNTVEEQQSMTILLTLSSRSSELQGRPEDKKQAYVIERYEALVEICDKWEHIGLFSGYGAWLRLRIQITSNQEMVEA